MHPRIFASTHADKPAMIMEETGQTLTYGQLEPIANQGAQFIRSQGIKMATLSHFGQQIP